MVSLVTPLGVTFHTSINLLSNFIIIALTNFTQLFHYQCPPCRIPAILKNRLARCNFRLILPPISYNIYVLIKIYLAFGRGIIIQFSPLNCTVVKLWDCRDGKSPNHDGTLRKDPNLLFHSNSQIQDVDMGWPFITTPLVSNIMMYPRNTIFSNILDWFCNQQNGISIPIIHKVVN